MGYRDGIVTTLALALSSVALAGIVYSDVYSRAAQTEASGYHALTKVVLSGAADDKDTALLSAAQPETAQQ